LGVLYENKYYKEYVKKDDSIIVSSRKGESTYLGVKTISAIGQYALEIC